jgi:hypothetical protein
MNATIVALGHPIKGPALALYERVRELFPQRSIAFKAADPGYRGRVRIEQRRLLIWFSPKSVDVDYVLAHEFANAVDDALNAGLRIDPKRPVGVSRQLVSDLSGLMAHRAVNAILNEYGVDVETENRQETREFIDGIRSTQTWSTGTNLHLAIGYAHALSVDQNAQTTAALEDAMSMRPASEVEIGRALAQIVEAHVRDRTARIDAWRDLCRIVGFGQDFQDCVMTQEHFRARFGWA